MKKFAAVGSTVLVGYNIYKSNNYTTLCTHQEGGNNINLSHHVKQMEMERSQESLLELRAELLVDPSANTSILNSVYSGLRGVKNFMQNNITFSSEDHQARIYGYSVNHFIPLANVLLKLIYRNKPMTDEDEIFKDQESGPSTWYYKYLITPFYSFTPSDLFMVGSIIHTMTNPAYEPVCGLLATAVSTFLMQTTQPFIDSYMPIDVKYYQIAVLSLQFFKRKADVLQNQHKMWLEEQDPQYYNPLFEYIDVSKANTYINWFVLALTACFDGRNLTEKAMKDLSKFIWEWYNNSYEKSKL